MITYSGQDLFSSGPARVLPGPINSRDAVAEAPGTIGASLIGQGISPRSLTQLGTLFGDSPAELQAQIDAVAQQVGAEAAELIDGDGVAWPGCVMRRFEPEAPRRIGPRYASDYTIEYLQTTP